MDTTIACKGCMDRQHALDAAERERDEFKRRLGLLADSHGELAAYAKEDRGHAHAVLMATQADLSAKLATERATVARLRARVADTPENVGLVALAIFPGSKMWFDKQDEDTKERWYAAARAALAALAGRGD